MATKKDVLSESITAQELHDRLQKDVRYQEMLRIKEEQRLDSEKKLKEETKELIRDLKKARVNASSIWDLVNTKNIYPDAIQILINHLKKEYHEKTKAGIIRSLSVKETIGSAPALIEE